MGVQKRIIKKIVTLRVFLISLWLPSCKQQLLFVNSKQNDIQKLSDATKRFFGVCLFVLTVLLVDDLPDIPSAWRSRKKIANFRS